MRPLQPGVARLRGDRVPQLHRAPVVADQVDRLPVGEDGVEHRHQVVDEALGAVAGTSGRRVGGPGAPHVVRHHVPGVEGEPGDHGRPRCPAGRGSRAPAPRWAVRGRPGCARGRRASTSPERTRSERRGGGHVTKGTEPSMVVARHGANVSRDPPGADVCPGDSAEQLTRKRTVIHRGPDGVPSEGALRQARRAGDRRHRRRERRGRRGSSRGSRAAASSSRPRSRPAAAARPAASSSPRPPTRPSRRPSDILGMDIKGHTVHRVLIAPAADIAEEYYFSFLVDRANRDYLCIASIEGGVEIEVAAHENPDAIAQVSIDPQVGVDDAKAAEIVAATGFPAEVADQADGRHQEAVGRLHRGGRHAGRGQPARACSATATSRRSTARSPSTRTPTSGTRTTRRSRTRPRPTRSRPRPRRRASTTSSSTARSASSATARAWSCRRSTSSPTPVRSTAA